MELKHHLGVACQTAWNIKNKLMHAMLERDENKQLLRIVEGDDAYPGGEKPGGKRGRGSENKQPFIAAVETDDEYHYRFNRRFNLKALMPRLVRADVDTPPLPDRLLKLAANFR